MSLRALLNGAEPLESGFRLTIPEDWHQGRTAYGGLSAALALEAARGVGGELPPLRSAAVSFVGPLNGRVEARARVLRNGRNVTWVAADILSEGEVSLAATFVFMGPVASGLHLNERPMPLGTIPVEQAKERISSRAPAFLSAHFDVRFALPPAERPVPEICLWVRPRDREGIDPATALLLSADALPPGVFPLLMPNIPPVSSMTWQANLLTPTPATGDGWWLLRSRGDYAENGCSSQIMEAWNTDGQPVMIGMQSVALFG